MIRIRKTLEAVLLWPSLVDDEGMNHLALPFLLNLLLLFFKFGRWRLFLFTQFVKHNLGASIVWHWWYVLNSNLLSYAKTSHQWIKLLGRVVILVCIVSLIQAFLLLLRPKLIYGAEIAGNAVSRNCVLEHVVHHIVHDENKGISGSNLGCENSALHGPMLLSFRLCMVNVLISTCQKISDFGKKPFTQKALPLLIHSAEVFGF